MRWMRSFWGVGFILPGLFLPMLACGTRVGTPHESTPGQSVQLTDGGPLPRLHEAGPPDAGVGGLERGEDACPARQQRCCDGQCGTQRQCAQLACDPAPHRLPVPEER